MTALTASSGPPRSTRTVTGWARANLFSSRVNSILTVLLGVALAWAAYRLVAFVFVNADWEIVRRNMKLFLTGRFPREELWRAWVSTAVLIVGLAFATGAIERNAEERDREAGRPHQGTTPGDWARRLWPVVLLVVAVLGLVGDVSSMRNVALLAVGVVGARRLGLASPRAVRPFAMPLAGASLVGSLFVLNGVRIPYVTVTEGVSWDLWGGLQLTIFCTVAGIATAFPLGLVLALGRRSSLPLIRWMSITYIELVRGVPLISLLLMGNFMLGFFLPPGSEAPAFVTRAIVAIVLFEAAYIAEVVRGGLQSIPRGQVEAAQAVGLAQWKVLRLIVLPQALRAVIPAMVGQFISLLKDTSLLAIIGRLELLEVGRVVNSQPDFLGQGLQSVTLAFVGFVYWVGAYTMSRESQRLEVRLGVGER